MSRVAATIPAENDLLCEGCGYTLNGLPEHSNCPECGKPIAESVGALRGRPAWEQAFETNSVSFRQGLWRSTFDVLFRPTHYYRTLATRGSVRDARRFGLVHMVLATGLASIALFNHARWLSGMFTGTVGIVRETLVWFSWPLTFILLLLLTHLAARLTAWEAAFRGLRMPRHVVLRALYYHTAHYLPVALVVLVTIKGYRLLVENNVTTVATLPAYLYVLSAEVVLGAFYLFWTYWIGMRNIMYANR